jgi:hypothetical protein
MSRKQEAFEAASIALNRRDAASEALFDGLGELVSLYHEWQTARNEYKRLKTEYDAIVSPNA